MSFVFEIGQIYHGAILSLRAYRRRVQDSEVKVVSLLKCRSLSKLSIIVHWKYAFPRQLVNNFSCLSLKLVKLAFLWRWIFAFVAGWHVGATLILFLSWIQSLPIVKWSTALLVNKHHTKIRIFFLFWPGHSQKNTFLKRARKEYMLHYVEFQEFIFIVAIPEITGNQVKSYM